VYSYIVVFWVFSLIITKRNVKTAAIMLPADVYWPRMDSCY